MYITEVAADGTPQSQVGGLSMRMFSSEGIAITLTPFRVVLGGDGHTVYAFSTSEYLVTVFDLKEDTLVRQFTREYERVKRPKREKPDRKPRFKLPERKHEHDIKHILPFGEGILVCTSTESKKKGALYDLFSNEGRFLDSFYIDVKGTVVGTHGNFLFVREEKSDGTVNIVKYEILENLM